MSSKLLPRDHRLCPGEIIHDEMDARGWTYSHLATLIGWPEDVVRDLLAGHMLINERISRDLGEVFGVSEQFFLNLENNYRAV